MSEDSLYHHGIKGQRWGVRRFQNADGTLTKKGRDHYYSRESGLSKEYRNLGPAGFAFNKENREKADRYANAVHYNAKRMNPNFDKEYEDYKSANKKNNEHYISERQKWLNQEGKYKGKDYYQFKDISREDWLKTEDAKTEKRAHDNLEKMIKTAAKEHPLYEKTFSQLDDINLRVDSPAFIKQVKYGEYAVNKILRDLEQEARKEHKQF